MRGRSPRKPRTVDAVADFETTTDPDDCRVWLWGYREVMDDESFVWGTSLDSFIEHISGFSSRCNFHNLAFDGRFILSWLCSNGYSHTLEKTLKRGQFTTLISRMGKFYSITVQWKGGKRTEFRDSLKKLPMPVARVGEAFRAEKPKGKIDYTMPRSVGYAPTQEEVEYVRSDVDIVAHALRQQLLAGMTRLTVGADSLAEYKQGLGSEFDRFYPVLPETMDAEIRKAYRGGWTYADERFRGRVHWRPIRVYDVNSLYPSVMYDRVLPYGDPVWSDSGPEPSDDYPLFITMITFTAKLKPEHVPCIQIKHNPFFQPSQYVSEVSDPVTMPVTNVDLALWEEHYDLDILSFEGTWSFKGASGMFCEYIDKWMEVKATTKGGLREIAKLHLNSLYGKFATNPDVTPKIPVLDEESGIVKLEVGPREVRDPVYTPMGVFITAYARDVTIRAAQQHYQMFAYADTDSLHLFTDHDPPTLDISPTKLGAWKHEATFEAGIYVRAKCYTEKFPEGTCTCGEVPHKRGCGFETHMAGVPDPIASAVEFDDYYNGHVFHGKLVPKAVPGGVVLESTSWELRDPSLA